MEQRKLIKLGNSSFAIALPKGWIDKSGLKKGDNIFLEENSNGEIIVLPSPKEKNNKKITLNVENKDFDSIKKEIRATYIRGYDIVKLEGVKEKAVKNDIKNILNNFLSFELVEGKDDSLVAKDFFNIEEASYTNFIRRMDNNIREIFDISLEEFRKDKVTPSKLKEVENIDKDVNKFYFLCSRVFLKGIDNPSILTSLKMNGMELFNNWWFAYNLEALSDYIKYFLKNYQKIEKKEIRDKILRLFLEIRDSYLKCMDSFYKEDVSNALQAIEITEKLKNDIENLGKTDSINSDVFNNLYQIQKQIYQNAKMMLYVKY